MPVIKFDVSGSDPEKARSGGEPPKPGIYVAKVVELKVGNKKGEAPTDENKRLEIRADIAIGKHKGYPLYDYIKFDEPSQWKMDQFLQAVGVASDSKRKGQFKTEEIIGMPVRVRVKADTVDGEYRPKTGAWIAGEDEDLTNPEFGTGEGESEELPDGEDAAAPAASGGDTSEYLTRAQLQEAIDNEDVPQLEEWANAFDIDHANIETWEEAITQILEAQGVGDFGGEEPPAPAKAPGTTKKAGAKPAAAAPAAATPEEDSYDDLDINALKAECKERGLPFVGVKAKLIERLRENDAEEPF